MGRLSPEAPARGISTTITRVVLAAHRADDALGACSANAATAPFYQSSKDHYLHSPSNTSPVLAASAWKTNAHLIADVARLGYLRKEWLTLDPTAGRMGWWKLWRPDNLVTHDIRLDGVDFRALPHEDNTFDAVAFDPPYVAVGGHKTSSLGDFHDRFGLTETGHGTGNPDPKAVQALINDGLTDCARVTKPRGFLLVKCQDYISSGKLWPGTHLTVTHGLSMGLNYYDRLEHYGCVRAQPSGRRQVHARRNLSTLLVFRKGKA